MAHFNIVNNSVVLKNIEIKNEKSVIIFLCIEIRKGKKSLSKGNILCLKGVFNARTGNERDAIVIDFDSPRNSRDNI